MGGLGPGYEQAIQVLAIEIVRDNLDSPLPKGVTAWGDSTVRRIDKKIPDGRYSCAVSVALKLGRLKIWPTNGWKKVRPRY